MKKIRGTGKRPRLSVFRSNRAIYAQIVDDEKGKTLVAASEKEIKLSSLPAGKAGDKATKLDRARGVGEALAKKALKKKIKAVVFDRRRYGYHGRVKALAEGARSGGLDF